MRIIAGDFKGRKLVQPKDNNIRPTSDKVKEALFSILMPYIYDANFCDLFAGTGEIGLEAISRGAKHSYFGDVAGDSVKIIKENVSLCNAWERSTVINGLHTKTLNRIQSDGIKIDIFFMDPPYASDFAEDAIAQIQELGILAEDGIVVFEHSKTKEVPEELNGLKLFKKRIYGSIALSFYM